MADIISKLEKEQMKNARLEQIAARQSSQTEPQTTSTAKSKSDMKTNSVEISETNQAEKVSKPPSENNTNAMETADNDSAKSLEPMDTDSSEQLPSAVPPMDIDCVQNNQSSTVIARNSGSNGQMQQGQSMSSRQGAEALRNMNIPGIEVITPDDFHNLTPQEQQVERLSFF